MPLRLFHTTLQIFSIFSPILGELFRVFSIAKAVFERISNVSFDVFTTFSYNFADIFDFLSNIRGQLLSIYLLQKQLSNAFSMFLVMSLDIFNNFEYIFDFFALFCQSVKVKTQPLVVVLETGIMCTTKHVVNSRHANNANVASCHFQLLH